MGRVWEPFFHRYQTHPPPSWAAFADRFGFVIDRLVRAAGPFKAPPLVGADVAAARDRLRNATVVGLDGWEPRDFKLLRDELMDEYAALLNAIEEVGYWPSDQAIGRIALLDKGAGPLAEQKRPITILTLLYRICASIRLRQMMDWVERWLFPTCFSRRESGAEAAWLHLALKIEQAILEDTPLRGSPSTGPSALISSPAHSSSS